MKRNPNKGLALLLLAMSQLILALDYTIIFVALPSVAVSLGFSAAHLQWVVSAYSLAYGGFLLLGGRLSDMLGRRRMFVIAIALFGLGSLLGGLAHSQLLLILARGLQGLGGALLSPATLSLIMSSFDEGAERNRALGIWAAMGGVGLSLGLLLGGLLTSYIGWESTFFVNVPITLLILLLTPKALQESKSFEGKRRYDAAGTLTATSGMILLVYYLVQGPAEGWLNSAAFIPGLAGALLLLLFAFIEQRTRDPLVPFRLFRNRNLTGAALTAALFSASFGTLYYFLTLYTQQVLHDSAIQSGLTFLPLTVSAFLGAKLVGRLLPSAGVAGTLAIGMGLGGAGFLLLTRLTVDGSAWGVIPGTVIIGIGQALIFTTMYIAGSTGVDLKEQGIASAIISTGQQLGGSVGLAVIMAVLSSRLGGAGLEALDPAGLNGAVRTAFLMDASITLLGILLAFASLRSRQAAAGDTKVHAAH